MTEATNLTLGTSVTQMNSRTNSHTSDLFNNMFGKPNVNNLVPSVSTQYGNHKFKEAVLAEAAREKKQQKESERVKKEEQRLNKVKLSKVIHHNGNVVNAESLTEEEELDQQLRKLLESRRENELEKFRYKMKAVKKRKI